MNLRQQILIFRTCLAVLVTLKKIIRSNPDFSQKTAENLEPLIKQVNDEVNYLYREDGNQRN